MYKKVLVYSSLQLASGEQAFKFPISYIVDMFLMSSQLVENGFLGSQSATGERVFRFPVS